MAQSRGFALGLIGALLALALCSCLTTVGLEKYPRRVIDRPYVLPDSVKSWDTIKVGVRQRDVRGLPAELDYSFSYADLEERGTGNGNSRLQAAVIPIPFGVKRTVLHSTTDIIGYTAYLYVGFDEDHGWLVDPWAKLYGRRRLRGDLAWEGEAMIVTTLGEFGSGVPLAVGLRSGPLLQLGNVALRARAGVTWKHGPVNLLPYSLGQWLELTFGGDIVLPLSMQMVWSASRRLDVIVDVRHDSIGYRWGFRSTGAWLSGRLHWGETKQS